MVLFLRKVLLISPDYPMLVSVVLLPTPDRTTSEWQSDIMPDHDPHALLENGIIFNHETKILLREKFINVEFLVPFPNLDIQLHEHLNESVHTLQQLWKEPSIFCDLTFSSNFTTNDSSFDIDWILHHVQNE